MKTKIIMAAAILIMSIPAIAEFKTVSLAYEAMLSNLRVPPSQNSRIMFKECNDCESRSIRMTPETRFEVNGRSVGFERFRAVTRQIPDADTAHVTVLHHLESDTVVTVSVFLK